MRQTFYARIKIIIDSELSVNEVLKELEQNSFYSIDSTENVVVMDTEWLETTYNNEN
ncbi:hypothetical protein [Pseudoflavitalea rhizosphaerae]|uniref:hypothetical protein n=1 Tax=Pseudoflavitalea rhizosphaerae TaxID=1884793 RepID=UPI0013E00961|nr:hypothetical protein [Pseudoflavitalea rhizosphaerae]